MPEPQVKLQRMDGPSKNVFVTGHEGEAAGRSAFGESIFTQNTPVIQLDFTHIVPPRTLSLGVNGGSAVRNPDQGTMVVSTGTTIQGAAAFRSERALIYRAGQGNMGRYSAMFTTGVAQSQQFAGLLSITDGFAFGYNNADFGIIHRRGGDVELRELQVTTFASGAENATVTVAGNDYTVPLSGGGSLVIDANEIADSLNIQDILGRYQQVGDTVLYQSLVSLPQTDFVYSSSTSEATWTTVTTGVVPNEVFIPQADWNMDTKPDLIPTNLNVYQIQYQFLGSGHIEFFIEDEVTGGFIIVHRIKYANTSQVPSLKNPNLFIDIFVDSNGSTTDLKLTTVSMSGFRQGEMMNAGQPDGIGDSQTSSTTEESLFTIKVRDEVGGRLLLGETILNNLAVSTDSVKGAIFNVYRNATVNAVQDFSYHDKNESMILVDTTQATVTGGQIIGSVRIGREDGETFDFSEPKGFLLSNETLTVTAQVLSGASAVCGAFLSWTEGL